jgi:hypothetical protein
MYLFLSCIIATFFSGMKTAVIHLRLGITATYLTKKVSSYFGVYYTAAFIRHYHEAVNLNAKTETVLESVLLT